MSTTVTVSPKYQIVIPLEVRERMGIQPGQKVTFVEWQGTVAIVPVLQGAQGFGFLKGEQPTMTREKDFGEVA